MWRRLVKLNKISNNIKLFYIDIECLKCFRILPNENMFTKNGCIWCDSIYARKKKEK
jgi:hypothetical protein